MENEYSKVKVNNEIDFCSVTDTDVKTVIEKAFMKARVSYFLRWEKPSLLSKYIRESIAFVCFCRIAACVINGIRFR